MPLPDASNKARSELTNHSYSVSLRHLFRITFSYPIFAAFVGTLSL